MHVGATEFFVGIDVPFGIVMRRIQTVGDFATLDFAVPHIPSVPSADVSNGNDFGAGDDIEVGSLVIDIAVVDFGHLFDEFVIVQPGVFVFEIGSPVIEVKVEIRPYNEFFFRHQFISPIPWSMK